jgi:hypothetical protein
LLKVSRRRSSEPEGALIRAHVAMSVKAAPPVKQASKDTHRSARSTQRAVPPAGERGARTATPPAVHAIPALTPEEAATAGTVRDSDANADRYTVHIARFADRMGWPAAELLVRDDEAAREHARAHGTRAVADGGTVYLDPHRMDPATHDGIALLGHELTHLLQARVLGVRQGSYLEAEAEARVTGEQFATGGSLSRPRVAYRRAAADNPAAKKAAPTLSDEENFGFLSNGDIVIRSSWWGSTLTNPPAMKEILHAMKAAGYYWWMTETQLQYIGDGAVLDDKRVLQTISSEPFFQVYWDRSILLVIGPPPGSDFFFRPRGKDIDVIIRSDAIAKVPPAAFAGASVFYLPIPADLYNRLLDGLDHFTGFVSDAAARAPLLAKPKAVGIDAEPTVAGSLLTLSQQELESLYPGRYQTFLNRKSPKLEQPKPVKVVPTGGGTSISFDGSLSDEDVQFATKWLQTVHGLPTWGSGGPQIAGKIYYPHDIELMRQIDQHPLRGVILQKLQGQQGDLDYSELEAAIDYAEYEDAAQRLGVNVGSGGPKGLPWFEEKVRGQIFVEGLAYPGREVRIWFKKSNPQWVLQFQIVYTDWIIEKQQADGSWQKIDGPMHTREIARRDPDYLHYTFQEVGSYRINALVNHNWYYPALITEEVEVKTEQQRLGQLKARAYGGMGDSHVADDSKQFDTSLFEDVFGPERFSTGKEIHGEVPADWQRLSDDDRLKFVTTDRDNLNKLITQWDKPDASYAQRQQVDYAKDRRDSLNEIIQKILAQKSQGFVYFEARGAYLSRTEGVQDSPLSLLGMAHGEPEKMTVVLRDLTRLFEPEDFTFEGDGGSFNQAAETVFLKICKRYPAGRMSVLFETVSNANIPQKQTIGFELDTNTAWKSFRKVVWDPAVTIAVNLAGAILIVFVPGSAAIVLPILAVYNSIDTISRMSDLQDSGNLTTKAFAKGVVEIGLNVLPVIGEFKALSIAAKTAATGVRAVSTADKVILYGLQGVTVGGMLVLMTAEGLEQCRKLRDGDITEVAAIMAELEEARKANPNSPRVADLEQKLNAASTRALNRSAEVFADMAKSLAIILVPTATMSKIRGALAGKTLTALMDEGKFVHQDGVAPHYDPVDGVMKGDKSKVTPEVIEGLKQQYSTDQGIKQLQLEKIAGSDKVEIRYSKTAKAVSVAVDPATGITTVEAPVGMPFERVLKDAWDNHFSKQPGAAPDMPVLRTGELESTTKGSDIATRPGVQIGRRIATVDEGQSLLRRIGDGDQSAFAELGAEAPGRGLDTQSVEWGLGQTIDGQYVIIRGEAQFIDWSKTPGVKPIAHTHPMSQAALLKGANISFADLVKGAGENAANADKVMPSPADIKFMVENGLTAQTVQTPYVSKGGGLIGNPVRGAAGPKIDIQILTPERAGVWKGKSDVPVYKAHVRARAGGNTIWEADVWATHSPESGSQLMFNEPAGDVMTKPRAGAPGTVTGGGSSFSGAHDFTAANPVQARALNDWNRLQQSPIKYRGKFSWEEWLYRYEKEGLVFDVDGARNWKTPEGMVRQVEKFAPDAKAADVVKRLTTEGAGPTGATSTFKSFFETLVRRGLVKDSAELQGYIEKDISFQDRGVDYVRHKIKEHFKPQLMDQASPKRWSAARLQQIQADPKFKDLPWSSEPLRAKEAAGHREILDIASGLDSSDKGPMLEQWLQENVFTDAKSQVAASKGDIDAQLPGDQVLGDDRKIDLLDAETAIESKTVNDKLSADEASLDTARSRSSQLLDYLRMVSAEVKITVKGQVVQLKRLKYVFTTTKGAIANLDTIKTVLGDAAYKGKVSFDVYDSKGLRYTVSSLSDLAKPELAWLKP